MERNVFILYYLKSAESFHRKTVSGKTGKEEADSKGAVSQKVLRCISRARVDACGQIRASFLLLPLFSKISYREIVTRKLDQFLLYYGRCNCHVAISVTV